MHDTGFGSYNAELSDPNRGAPSSRSADAQPALRDQSIRRMTAITAPIGGATGGPAYRGSEPPLEASYIGAHIRHGASCDTSRSSGIGSPHRRQRKHDEPKGRYMTWQKVDSFVVNIHQERAHDWLSSNREVRPNAKIAAALRFKRSSLPVANIGKFYHSTSETRREVVMKFDSLYQ